MTDFKGLRLPALLSNNALKIIALICMTLDHVGAQLLPEVIWLRIVGRIAFPIFAYMIAEGARHTRKRARYLGTLAVMAVLFQIVFFFVSRMLYMSIFFTFTLSVCLIVLFDYALKSRTPLSYAAALGGLFSVYFICNHLPHLLERYYFFIDYFFIGVLIPVALYYLKERWQKLLAMALMLCLLAVWSAVTLQWWGLLALIPLSLYNGKRGKYKMKYLFYVYYPLHLVVIFFISQLL